MFPTFTILGKEIGMYGLISVVGAVVCAFVSYLLLRKYKEEIEDIILELVAMVVGILIGGHLLYGITQYKVIGVLFSNLGKLNLEQIWTFIMIIFGGSVFYGGIIGSYFSMKLYHKIKKVPNSVIYEDLFAVLIPLFHAFGRIGCFLGGCCYGIEANWGFTVHNNTLSPEINDVQRIPIQLIEAGFNIVIFIILMNLFKKEKFKGELVFVYMLIYPVVRFIDEFYRGDNIRGFIFGLSTSQWISIILFTIAVLYFIIKIIKNKNKNGKIRERGNYVL